MQELVGANERFYELFGQAKNATSRRFNAG